MSMLHPNYAPPIRHRMSWRARLSRWLYGPPAPLMRDPFWAPMAEPPMPDSDVFDRRPMLLLMKKWGITLEPWQEDVIGDGPMENPREALRYLDICPPEISGWTHEFHAGQM